jgi:hypothetical protein
MPVAWARTFIEKTSAVQIHVVAPHDGLSGRVSLAFER